MTHGTLPPTWPEDEIARAEIARAEAQEAWGLDRATRTCIDTWLPGEMRGEA